MNPWGYICKPSLMQQLWRLKNRIRESPSLSPAAGINVAKPIKASSTRAGSEHCLINRESTFIYPGLFKIWITSLGAFPMLPVGSGITPGCKGLFHNIHPSKSSNLALSEASAPEGAHQYHRNCYICTWTSWTKDVLHWRGRHSCILRAVETWAFRQTSTL